MKPLIPSCSLPGVVSLDQIRRRKELLDGRLEIGTCNVRHTR